MEIGAIFSKLRKLPCWHVEWDANTNLSMCFGKPSLSIREPREVETDEETLRQFFRMRSVTVKGEYLFWITSAYWKLTTNDLGPVTQASSYKRKQMAMARLDGQKIIYAKVDPKTAATHLEFDLGAELKIRRYGPSYDYVMWMLYFPGKYVLSVRGDGQFKYAPGNTPKDQEVWQPISTYGDWFEARYPLVNHPQPNPA